MVRLIAAERHWSISFGMVDFSVGLLVAGLGSPFVGRSIDRFGGHVVMTIGSLIGGLGLFFIVYAAHPIACYARSLVFGVSIAGDPCDSPFATLGRQF